jgi:spermidine synthase
MSVGQTLHGHQFAERRLAGQATTYFHEQSGVGLALSTLDRPPARRVGVIGLGVGSLATYARAGDTWRFYEINPDVPRLAQTRFTFLRDCAAPPAIVLGDGRLSLEREPPQGFDVLVLDAFSGDAIPAHLLTCEAFRVYLRHLNGRGMVAAHITNQHLDLQPVLRRVAAELGLHTAFIATSGDLRLGLLDALWVLLSPNPDLLQHQTLKPFVVPASPQWRELPLWTDEFFSLFPLLR